MRGAPSSSTRLEVPSGTDIKITIEVLSKSKPPPSPQPVEVEPAAPEAKKLLDDLRGPPQHPVETHPAAPPVSRIPATGPIWDLARIKPEPQPPIPHDPPPHEGAMVDMPYVAEPPDLIRVEVLEALPGRPDFRRATRYVPTV